MKTQSRLVVLCLAILAPPAFSQEKPKPDAADAVMTGARKIDDKEAKELVATFQKQIKDNKTQMKGRIDACIALARVENKLLVNPLMTLAQRETSKAVRQEAIRAIGSQSMQRARPALLTLLKKYDIKTEPGTAATIIRAIGSSCYIQKDWRDFKRMFDSALTDPNAVDAQKAIIEVFGKHKEVEAIEFLLEHMDGPTPANVDAGDNPPASYWEARWKNWANWKVDVLESVYQITGQRFGTSKEAKQWLRKNKAKMVRDSKIRNASDRKKSRR